MKKIYKGRTYKCPKGSIYISVMRIYYQNEDKVSAKLCLHYKDGTVLETKSYKLLYKNIQHWGGM